MATKKNMLAEIEANAGVFNQIAKGHTQNVQNIKDVQNVQKVQNTPDKKDARHENNGRPLKYDADMERLNLKIPAELKEYLTIAAAKKSIAQRRTVSLTEYLVDLVKEDMKQNKEE